MKANVRLFARLSEIAGERKTEVEVGEGLTVHEAFQLLCRRYPAMSLYDGRILFAVNGEYVGGDHPLGAGDELALIPPVSGGAVVL